MKRFIFVATIFCVSLISASDNYEKIDDQCMLKIVTPDLAERKTAKIRLSNGLEAYLISDPGVHQSCAAVAVEAGSWQDPEEYPGMAHFLEHMLFMGTKPYPNEAEYLTYITEHGGERNAYTTTDRTVYSFSINNDFFVEGLDRFSHFFIDPLFQQGSVGRELKNIDQEHGKNLDHDGWRAWMILKETGNQNHPNVKFSTGNAATLGGIPQSALKKWYETHYSANIMHLVMISPMPIEEMIELASSKFSRVVNRNIAKASYPFDILSEQQKGHFLYITPVKDIKNFSMIWQLPRELALDVDTHATALVAYVLSNDTQNSLYEELKREKLIESISVSVDPFSVECHIFNIDFSLTEYGMKHLDMICERTFQAIARIKEIGIPKYIFDEHQKLALMNYEHQSRDDAFTMATEIAGELTREKIETYPQKQVLATRYDTAQIQALLNVLSPETALYLVSADPKLTGVLPTSHEKWMNAPYSLKPTDHEKLIAWSSCDPHPRVDVPSPNPYFPDSLALVPIEDPLKKVPTALINDDFGTLYFMQDQKYQVPETTVIFGIKTPEMNGDALSRVLFDLYIRSLQDKLCSHLFFANEAGLHFDGYQKDDLFILTLSGYSEKTPLFLKTIFSTLRNISPTAAEFEIFKQSLLSTYDNASKELALKQSLHLLHSVLMKNHPTAIDRYIALQGVTYEQFLSFASGVFQTAYVEGTIHGNLTSQDALEIWRHYKTEVSPSPFPRADHYKNGVLIPSDQKGPYMLVKSTERQGNSALLLIHEGPFTQENRAVQQILSSALSDDFFDTLRSKQHTGYIAQSWDIKVEEQLFQLFGVQSISHEPSELLARFDLFLEEFSRDIQTKISLERFEMLKATLIKELEKPPENLGGKTSQLHVLGFEKKGDFEWLQKRIESTKALSYETFIQRAQTELSRQNKRRIAILMNGVLPSHTQLKYEEISHEKIRDVGSYISAR